MKKLFLILLSAVALVTQVVAKEYVFVLSPFEDVAKSKEQATFLLQLATTLEAGDHVIWMDGWNLKTLGEFSVPEDASYSSPRARLNFNRAGVAALLQFADSASLPAGPNNPTARGAILLPQLLRHIANTLPHEESLDVLILASPFYDNPTEPTFSMVNKAYPSDGNLQLPRTETPYGAAGQPTLLSNIRVHFGYEREAIFVEGQQQKYYVERFWTLFVELLGGEMVTFTSDQLIFLKRLKEHASAPDHDYKLEESTKKIMYYYGLIEQSAPIFDRVLSNMPSTDYVLSDVPGLGLGLTWDCAQCDLDLYVMPYADAGVLYFNNTKTPEGMFFRDIRQATTLNKGFETINVTVPVDIRNLGIAVNFFGGSTLEGVSGELRLSMGNETWSRPFHLAANVGNLGEGALQSIQTGTAVSSHTMVFSPLSIIGIE